MSRPPHNERSGRRGAEAFARDWLETAGTRLALGLKADIVHKRDSLAVTLTSDGKGFGHRRPVQVASALQTLLETAMAREGFRETVEVSLSGDAGAQAAEAHGLMAAVRAAALTAAQRGRAFALGPMSVADRRQIHQALGEVPQVWTQSEGDGIFRRLWIVPRTQVTGQPAAPHGEEPTRD